MAARTPSGKPLVTAYVYDEKFKRKANKGKHNYWYEYLKEMNEQMGLRAVELDRRALGKARSLKGIEVLIIGDLDESDLTTRMRANLDGWVQKGGVLIGFATRGLDDLFGNSFVSETLQPGDGYTISGYFDLVDDPLTVGVHSYLHPDQKLIIISPIRNVTPRSSSKIAHLYRPDGSEAGHAAITARSYGRGHAYYFAFNVPQTVWLLHQGRPIAGDVDGDGYLRTLDMITIGRNNPQVLYADEMLFLIQNMISRKRQPFIHQIPPKDGRVPDALIFWGGDDEFVAEAQLKASDFMKSVGLPYHINILYRDGKFNITKDDVEAIMANGHEVSLHYNFIDGFSHPSGFTEKDIKKQEDAFFREFGFHPICIVNHWLRWTGWAEPAKWMRSVGIRADNSFAPALMEDHKKTLDLINALGFSFGTSFPFYFYDDYKGGNAKVDFLEEPISGYELGYTDPHIAEDMGERALDPHLIKQAVDLAVHYHLTLNMFRHPPRIHRTSYRLSIQEMLKYIESRGLNIVHVGNDALWRWWDRRSASTVGKVMVSEWHISFNVRCENESGLIVKVPIGDREVKSATCDGSRVHAENKREFGQNWAYAVVPFGTHALKLSLSSLG